MRNNTNERQSQELKLERDTRYTQRGHQRDTAYLWKQLWEMENAHCTKTKPISHQMSNNDTSTTSPAPDGAPQDQIMETSDKVSVMCGTELKILHKTNYQLVI